MEVEVKKMKLLEKTEGNLRAFCDIQVGDVIIKGCRMVEGKNGVFLALPQTKGKDDKWYPIVQIIEDDTFKAMQECAKESYKGSGGSGSLSETGKRAGKAQEDPDGF